MIATIQSENRKLKSALQSIYSQVESCFDDAKSMKAVITRTELNAMREIVDAFMEDNRDEKAKETQSLPANAKTTTKETETGTQTACTAGRKGKSPS